MIRVLWGEDAFSLAAEEKRLIADLVEPEWRSVNLTVFEGATAPPAQVAEAARTPSFFGNRLVVVRDCPWFAPAARRKKDEEEPDAKPAADAGSTAPLIGLLEAGMPGGCHLLLLATKALNKTMSTTKALLAAAGAGRAEIREFPGPDPYRPERTVQWLVGHAPAMSAGIERSAAELLVDRLGQDKYLLDSELRKLGAFAGDRAVQAADVALLSPPGESDVFELLEAIVARDLSAAITHMRRLTAHDHPLKILATLATFLGAYLRIKLLAERRAPEDAIASAVKWHPFRVKKAIAALRSWSGTGLAAALYDLAEAEQALKGSGLPDRLVLERLLARLAA